MFSFTVFRALLRGFRDSRRPASKRLPTRKLPELLYLDVYKKDNMAGFFATANHLIVIIVVYVYLCCLCLLSWHEYAKLHDGECRYMRVTNINKHLHREISTRTTICIHIYVYIYIYVIHPSIHPSMHACLRTYIHT